MHNYTCTTPGAQKEVQVQPPSAETEGNSIHGDNVFTNACVGARHLGIALGKLSILIRLSMERFAHCQDRR